MKEVKAYVRPTVLETVIHHLEEAGARDLTVIRVDALAALADAEKDRWHILRKYSETYSACAKLEIVCRDEEAREFAEIISDHAHLGEKGDGRVFIYPVEDALNIRTGARGADAL
ncbi:MAG: P-II family nitrogen regulator [Candidatus Brocadiia bacterium]